MYTAHQSIADRVRTERELERFSQSELAKEIGVSRSALAHIERGHYPLGFQIGLALCRRLDLNPRWLATGEEPKRPFVPPDNLKIAASELKPYLVRGVEFMRGYDMTLRRPLDAWAKRNPPEKLILGQLQGHLANLLRRFSNAELVDQLRQAIDLLRREKSESARGAVGDHASAVVQEISVRLTSRR